MEEIATNTCRRCGFVGETAIYFGLHKSRKNICKKCAAIESKKNKAKRSGYPASLYNPSFRWGKFEKEKK